MGFCLLVIFDQVALPDFFIRGQGLAGLKMSLVLSYLFIYRALVVQAIEQSYVQLVHAQDELQLAVKASNTGSWDWHLDTQRCLYSPVWKAQMGCDEVQGYLCSQPVLAGAIEQICRPLQTV